MDFHFVYSSMHLLIQTLIYSSPFPCGNQNDLLHRHQSTHIHPWAACCVPGTPRDTRHAKVGQTRTLGGPCLAEVYGNPLHKAYVCLAAQLTNFIFFDCSEWILFGYFIKAWSIFGEASYQPSCAVCQPVSFPACGRVYISLITHSKGDHQGMGRKSYHRLGKNSDFLLQNVDFSVDKKR